MEVLIIQNLFHGILHAEINEVEAVLEGMSFIRLKPLHHDTLNGSVQGIRTPLSPLHHLSYGFAKFLLFMRGEESRILPKRFLPVRRNLSILPWAECMVRDRLYPSMNSMSSL